jgi:hypothetical protein
VLLFTLLPRRGLLGNSTPARPRVNPLTCFDLSYSVLLVGLLIFNCLKAYTRKSGTPSRITHHSPGPSGTTSDGTGTFNVNREVTYPLRPFLGTIVTAPERGIGNTLVSQGPWGGNIDCRDVRKGNRIMLDSSHDGGLLFFGDAHAAQGDSEYTGLPTSPPQTL